MNTQSTTPADLLAQGAFDASRHLLLGLESQGEQVYAFTIDWQISVDHGVKRIEGSNA
jgi:hypothetical protein